MLKNLAAVSAALLISTGAASAATMFSDDFSTWVIFFGPEKPMV